jgi:methyl-accepting chemotaxis protein
VRLSLSFKIVGIAGASIALVALILAFSFAREVQKLLEQELTNRGRLAVLTLANSASSALLAQDVSGLATLASASRADVNGAAYVTIRDEQGRVVADAVAEGLGSSGPEAMPLDALNRGARVVERTASVGGKEMLQFAALVTFKGKAELQYMDPLGLGATGGAGTGGVKELGVVEIGFPLEELRSQIGAASRRSLGLATVVFVACLLAMYPLASYTTRPLMSLTRAALGIADGDLRQDVRRSGNDEVSDLARSFARMVSELQGMLGELKGAASSLAQESDVMLGAATRQAAMAAQQSASITEMNASIREIAQTSTAATDHADRVIVVTQAAEESAVAGEGVVEEAVSSTTLVEQQVSTIGGRLGDLSARVSQIGDIIGTVKDLALRSNVLALNAAIQAARSGEDGASFSVIAREMRALAEQSSGTAGEVPKLLGEIVEYTASAASATQQGSEKARSTAALARRAGATIGNLANVCRESATAARLIADSSRQQATGVNEIVATLTQLARAAESNVEGSEEMRRVAERLKTVSARLTGLAERYLS